MATMAASYYDTIGLLALNDAIETVDGIKLRNFADHANGNHTDERAKSILTQGPPYSVSSSITKGFSRQASTTPGHTFLAHVPAYLSGDNGPSVPVHGASLVSGPGAIGQSSHYYPGSGAPGASPIPNQGYVNLPPNLLPRDATGQGTLLGRSDPYSQPLPARAHMSPSAVGRPTAVSSNVGSPQNMAPRTQNYRQSASAGSKEFKREICPICNRIFEGPKASTHKQQHIRRLHPQDYMPKRGGKKRVVIDSLTGEPTTLGPGQNLPGSPQGNSPPNSSYGSPGIL